MPAFPTNDFQITDSADLTKVLQFSLSGIPTATTRTLAMPDGSGTVQTLEELQTEAQIIDGDWVFNGAVNCNGVTEVTFLSDNSRVVSSADTSKAMSFACSGIEAGKIRTVAAADVPGLMCLVGNGADPPAADAMGKVAKTAQAAAVAATKITDSCPAGFYEVSYYLSCTTANVADGTIAFQVSYTDRVGATNQATASTLTLAATSTGTTALKGVVVLYLASGDITYQTNLTGVQTTSRYSLDARIKHLG